MAAISGTGTSRPDGAAYIDVQDPAQAGDGDVDHEELERHASGSTSGSSSGSSVVEGEDDEGPPDWGPDDEGLLPPRDTAGSEDEDELYYEGEEEEWDVEDEDWELAHGDFTKHYNRARQQQAAMTSTKEPTMLLNGGTTLAKPPLPSRNVHVNQQQLHAQKKNQIAGPSTTSALSSRQVNALKFTGGVSTNPKAGGEKQEKDKSDRATQEQVLDNRTRLVLKSLGGRGVITKIENCISTGKEANVYYSTTGSNEDLAYKGPVAVKIYRTSILNFRSRQNYIVGEQRFKGEYTSSKNPRKMIKVWAEKELRNLRRLKSGGIRTPVVLECRENVLVMEFLGTDGGPSPRLKDAEIPEEELPMLYAEMIVGMRRIYQHCHLVHADLSEYNVLYHDSHLYIIDVSQSVEHDHPRSFDFLRMDIRNIKDYFARRSNGAFPMLSLRRTWDFIVNEELDGINRSEETSERGEEKLLDSFRDLLDKYAIEQQDEEGAADKARQNELDDDAVFMSSYIPKNLSEIYDPERDVELVNQGKGANLIYAGVTGLNDVKRRNDKTAIEGYPESAIQEATTSTAAKSPKNTEPAQASTTKEQDSEAAKETTEESLSSALKEPATIDSQLSGELEKKVRFDDEEDVDGESGEDDEEDDHENRPRGFRHEDKESKKERKKAVKEEQREKRKTKMSKAEKQRLIKKSSR